MRAKGRAALAHYLQSQVGQEVELLMERNGVGRTPGFAEMALDSAAAARAKLLSARVTRSDGMRLQGERLAPKCGRDRQAGKTRRILQRPEACRDTGCPCL